MDERESEETTEFSRVPDMPGYYISSNAPHSGEFVTVAMHDKLKRQRDMLLDALKPIIEYPGIREYIGSILADKAQATIAAVENQK